MEKVCASATSSSISGSVTYSVLAKQSIMVDSQNPPAPKHVFTSAKKKGDNNDDVDDDDDGNNNEIPELQDVSDDEDEDGDNGEEAYNRTKMFGDLYHEVCML